MAGGHEEQGTSFSVTAGIVLGLGLGGFFDGIVFHQVLQWHHMLSSTNYPPTSLENLQLNTLWDGFFHILSYLLTGLGLALFWRAARRPHAPWSGKLLVGALLMGWGLFNLVEGIINHHLLGIHHVREDVPNQLLWDLGFLIWGALMLGGGWVLYRAGQRATAAGTHSASHSPSVTRPG